MLVKEDEDDPGRLAEVILNGERVSVMAPEVPPTIIPDDDKLILVVSDRMTGRIRQLTVPDSEDSRGFARAPQLAHIGPNLLPNQWFGLDMVDCVVWDQADPSQLTDAQQRALVEWVSRGGELLVGAARTADMLSQSDHFGPLLPVDIGAVAQASSLSAEAWRLYGFDELQHGPIEATPYVKCKTRSGKGVREWLVDEALDSTMISSRVVGKGRLTFVACGLDDLLAGCGDPVVFFRHVLELRRNPIGMEQAAQYSSLFRFLDREDGVHGERQRLPGPGTVVRGDVCAFSHFGGVEIPSK